MEPDEQPVNLDDPFSEMDNKQHLLRNMQGVYIYTLLVHSLI